MQYINAMTIVEAEHALLDAEGKAIIIAGGTDVMVDMKAGKIHPTCLVDITRIQRLKQIRIIDNKIHIGAAVTLTEVARSPIIRQYYPSLADGCGRIGSLQIRNSGTLIGNVVSAQPAADGAVAVSCLQPVFTVVSATGYREIAMPDMYTGFGKSIIRNNQEIVTELAFDLPEEGEAASFVRLQLRQSLSLPMLNTAAKVSVQNGVVTKACLTAAPVGVGPVRLLEAENYLIGKEMTDDVLKEAGALSLKNANPRSNPLRGSKEFRVDTLPVIVRRALEDCRAQLQ